MCEKCKGKGFILVSVDALMAEAQCDKCNGSGKSRDVAACKTCNDTKTTMVNMSEVDCPDCNATQVVNR